jgi:hypothetical protein
MDKVEASYKLNTLSSLELDAERVRLIEGGNFCYKVSTLPSRFSVTSHRKCIY